MFFYCVLNKENRKKHKNYNSFFILLKIKINIYFSKQNNKQENIKNHFKKYKIDANFYQVDERTISFVLNEVSLDKLKEIPPYFISISSPENQFQNKPCFG